MYLLPKPQTTKVQEGNYYLPYDGKIEIRSVYEENTFYHAQLLKQEIKTQTGFDYEIMRGNKKEAIILRIEEKENDQAYSLEVNEDGVQITGGSEIGLLYGIQTLRQMLKQEGGMLPYLVIEDFPQMNNRGFYHDVTRGRIPKMSWLKKLADTLSFYKMNQMQLYIEHTYLFEDQSEVWRDDTPLTAEDILELDEYCARIGIELVPSLSCFGHLYKLLSTKTYSHLCEMPDSNKSAFSMYDRMAHHTINVTLEESYQLIESMIREYMPLFRSKQFNIGADETFDLGKGASKEKADEVGVERLYIDFVNRLCEFVISQGHRPMFWGDVICGFPEFIKELPKETICLNWGYAWDQKEDSTKALAEAGAVQYVCPGVGGWNQFMNLLESSYQNITRMCSYGENYHAIGMLNTDWGDFGHINHPAFSIPGIIYGACFSWNKDEIPFEDLNQQISRLEYGDRSERLLSVLAKMCKESVFNWWSGVRYQETAETGDMEKAKEYLLEKEKIEQAYEANQKLCELEQELYGCLKEIEEEKRSIANSYIIASEGMRLWNRLGAVLSKGAEAKKEEMRCLAGEIERWYYQYKNLWRTVSRESELFQITHLICWYADHLRELAE